MNFSASFIPLIWNTPCVFLGNSLNTRSRFDFARHEDNDVINKTSPSHPIQSFHSAPPGYDQPPALHSAPYPNPLQLRSQPTLAHPFAHTLPYHTQKTHI